MPDLPPYVESKDCIRVRATVRGQVVDDAVVLGWCGQDVSIAWRSDMGSHLGWVPAAAATEGSAAGHRVAHIL